MRTESLKKMNIIQKSLLLMLLLLAVTLTFCLSARPSYAADLSGEYTLDSHYTDITVLPDEFEPTTFELYKVGQFTSKESFAELIPPYDELPIGPIPVRVDGEDDVTWTKECLAYANTLSNLIPADAVPIKISVDEQGHFTKGGVDNGIYLLKGNSTLVKDYPEEGQNSYWWPQPMLVSVLDKDVSLSVKPMTELADCFRVQKVWKDENGKQDEVRPDSIRVKIYYDTKDEAGLRFTEVLNDANNWCFKWEPEKGEGDPSKWMVEEVTGDTSADSEKLKHYRVSIGTKFVKDDDGDTAIMMITNTYIPPETTTTTTTTSPSTTVIHHDKTHKTGDTFSYIKYIVLMAISLIVLIMILFGRKKRRDEERS